MSESTVPRSLKLGATRCSSLLALLMVFAGMSVGTATAEAVAPAEGPLAELSGHGSYSGLKAVGRDGSQPLRHPDEMWLSFGTIVRRGDAVDGKIDEFPVLVWEVNCNENDYRVRATPTRLRLGFYMGTTVLCLGPGGQEDVWLRRFFSADPHWTLHHGRLTLTAMGARIVMSHRRGRPRAVRAAVEPATEGTPREYRAHLLRAPPPPPHLAELISAALLHLF